MMTVEKLDRSITEKSNPAVTLSICVSFNGCAANVTPERNGRTAKPIRNLVITFSFQGWITRIGRFWRSNAGSRRPTGGLAQPISATNACGGRVGTHCHNREDDCRRGRSLGSRLANGDTLHLGGKGVGRREGSRIE